MTLLSYDILLRFHYYQTALTLDIEKSLFDDWHCRSLMTYFLQNQN